MSSFVGLTQNWKRDRFGHKGMLMKEFDEPRFSYPTLAALLAVLAVSIGMWTGGILLLHAAYSAVVQ